MVIHVKGFSVHAGLSHLGKNAADGSRRLQNALADLKEIVEKRTAPLISTHPNTGLERMTARLNVTTSRAGGKINVVPDYAEFGIDRRIIPGEDPEQATEEILECLRQIKVEWEVKSLSLVPPHYAPIDDPAINRLAEAIREVAGETGKYGSLWSSDLYTVAEEWGACAFGAGLSQPDSGEHGKNEFTLIRDIEELSEILAKFFCAN